MADPNPTPSTTPPPSGPQPARPRRLSRLRIWVQLAMAGVWLGPFGLRLHTIPGCVFHCYACPLASFACPVGVVAQFSALHLWPLLAIGVVLAAGALVGSLICGWACPFGLLQDLLGWVPIRRWAIPRWMGYGRYAVLLGLVVAVPYLWGESHPLFICRVCPAGAIEAGVPSMVSGALSGQVQQSMSVAKWAVMVGFVVASLVTYRPWCTVFCPLGGALGLLNRFSVFHLRFNGDRCTRCNVCRSRCRSGVHVERRVNTGGCIRCLECTSCGAITPSAGGRK